MEWISEEEKPKKRYVLGHWGKRPDVVLYIKKHEEEVDWDDFDPKIHSHDYVEETDTYYWPEGWYREEEQFSGCEDFIWTPQEVWEWMYLPEPLKKP